MKSIASAPRSMWNGQEEEVAPALSISRRVMRPMAVVAACLVMALVVIPTSGVAIATDRYNDDDDDDDDDGGNNITTIALIAVAVAGLIYLGSRDDDDDDMDDGM